MNLQDPLVKLMGQIETEKRSGILTLVGGDRKIRLYFDDGLMVAANASFDGHRLGQYLARAGLVEAGKLEVLLAEAARLEQRLGHVAVKNGLLTPGTLSVLLRQQQTALLVQAIEERFKVRSFEPGRQLFRFSFPVGLNERLLAMTRLKARPLPFDDETCVFLRPESRETLPGLPWSPEEVCVLSQIDRPRSLPDLVAESGLDSIRVRRILGVFGAFGIIETTRSAPMDNRRLPQAAPIPLERLVSCIDHPRLDEKLRVVHEPGSFVAEQFKSLKVRIKWSAMERPMKVIQVTSPLMKDGKSLVAANMALCFANDPGRRVVVVDCDLRNPTLHQLLGISNEPGVAGYLLEGRFPPACYLRRLGNLFVMGTGGYVNNPVEILWTDRMLALLNYLRQQFDTVILDAPPVQPISDARVVSRLADGIVMVIRRGKTPFHAVEQAIKVLDPKKLLGVVFNDVKPQRFNTCYDPGYYGYPQRQLYAYAGREVADAAGFEQKGNL